MNFQEVVHSVQTGNANVAVGSHERVENDIKCLRAAFERLEGGHDVFASPDF